MGFFSRLFGSEKAIDAGIKGIDKAFYTDEEKADNQLARIGLKERILKAYEPFKLAQRYMMLIVGTPYMAVWVGAAISAAWGADVASLERLLEGRIGDIFYMIAIFYFGGGVIEGGINAYKGSQK